MNDIMANLKTFALNDKYIKAELSLAWFSFAEFISSGEEIVSLAPESFWSWFLLFRKNSHYDKTPIEAAQNFQPDNFPVSIIPSAEIIIPAENTGEVKSEKSGLTFKKDFSIPGGRNIAGIFFIDGGNIHQTQISRSIRPMEAPNYSKQLENPKEFIKLLSEPVEDIKIKEVNDIVELEDLLTELFTALTVKDIYPDDITDKLEEREHPDTLVSEIKTNAEVFPETAPPYLKAVMEALQKELGIDSDEVKPPAVSELTVSDNEKSELDILFDQMLNQFQDEEQKSFYADFFDYIKENNHAIKGGSQQEAMGILGKLEKKWRKSKRDKLGGMTPEEYLLEHPGLEKSHIKTVKREQPKIGRNDPCPCGSGKKYKKCCGRNL